MSNSRGNPPDEEQTPSTTRETAGESVPVDHGGPDASASRNATTDPPLRGLDKPAPRAHWVLPAVTIAAAGVVLLICYLAGLFAPRETAAPGARQEPTVARDH